MRAFAVLLSLVLSVAAVRADDTSELQLNYCVYQLYSKNTDGSMLSNIAYSTDAKGGSTEYVVRGIGAADYVLAPVTRGRQKGFLVRHNGALLFFPANICQQGGPNGAQWRGIYEISHRIHLKFGEATPSSEPVRPYIELICTRDEHLRYQLTSIDAETAPAPGNPERSYLVRGPGIAAGAEELQAVQNVILAYTDRVREICTSQAASCDGGVFCRHNIKAGEEELKTACNFSPENTFTTVMQRWQDTEKYCHRLWENSVKPATTTDPSHAGSSNP